MTRIPPLVDAIGVHLLRFAVMVIAIEVAIALGVEGFALGLVANTAVTVLAVALMTWRGLWRSSGFTTAVRSRLAVIVLLPLVLEAVSWALPAGLVSREPGFGAWATTLLLVGINEELTSRGVVLSRLSQAYRPTVAVALTGALFGLQHLSAFALTDRAADDILGNVLLSGIYGFALAAYQLRFRWIWPLILVHATADFTTVLAPETLPDPVVGVVQLLMLGYGLVLLRGIRPSAHAGDASLAGGSR